MGRRTSIDPWFLRELHALAVDGDGTGGLGPTFRSVDTCAAEFEARTPYYYSAHERKGPLHGGEVGRGDQDSVVILGSGPNRIGQGIEFDYYCVHAWVTVRESGSRRGDDQLQPRDRLDRLRHLRPPLLRAPDGLRRARGDRGRARGMIVQFGGQTPLRLAKALQEAGSSCSGRRSMPSTSPRTGGGSAPCCAGSRVAHPPYSTAHSAEEAAVIAEDVQVPAAGAAVLRAGRRAMEICYSPEQLDAYLRRHVKADQEHPLLLDRFLEDTIEVDVDALADGADCAVAGIMQHVEEAGVPPATRRAYPPMSLGEEMLGIRETTRRLALGLSVVGLINIQYAVAGGRLAVIEANPRASRTVPFVSKAIRLRWRSWPAG